MMPSEITVGDLINFARKRYVEDFASWDLIFDEVALLTTIAEFADTQTAD